jgi:hypothetical protein
MKDHLLTITSLYIITKARYGFTRDEESIRIILDFGNQEELVVTDLSPMVALSPLEFETNITCLLIGRDKEPIYRHSLNSGFQSLIWNFCMVLKPSPRQLSRYERIGLLYNRVDQSYFDDARQGTFEII